MMALIIDSEVRDIERRDVDVYKYYHKEIAQRFVECDDTVTIGDKYIDGNFVKREDEETSL